MPPERFDFGARVFFQWLSDVGPTRIASVAWATSIATFLFVVGYDVVVMNEQAGRRTVLTDAKAKLRQAISPGPEPTRTQLGESRPAEGSASKG
jgi:hypothetical protein